MQQELQSREGASNCPSSSRERECIEKERVRESLGMEIRTWGRSTFSARGQSEES